MQWLYASWQEVHRSDAVCEWYKYLDRVITNRMTIKSGKRPVFLNLIQVRFPAAAVQSILHRLSGVCMVLVLPYVIYLFGLSLESEQGFASVTSILTSIPVKLVSALLVWALVHHLFAGVRYLLIDLEIGIEREAARRSAWAVMVGAVAVAAGYLLGILL